jgi:quercetin dioxygenase-like cupin family protein
MLAFSLRKEEEALRQRAQTASSGRAAKTLVRADPLRVTLISLRKGVSLGAHHAEGAVSIHALRGRVRVTAATYEVVLETGDLAVLQEEVTHSADALTDCTLLITVGMSPGASPA